MKKLLDYIIPVSGLSLGKHQYQFEIGSSFLKQYESLEVENGKVNILIDLIRESNLIDMDIKVTGHVELICDRCLDPFDYPIEGQFRLIVKFGDHHEEMSDEVLVVPADESRLDMSHYFYEYINLLIPFKKVHPDDEDGNSTCNQDMLGRLDEMSGTGDDPRWDALKNIKLS